MVGIPTNGRYTDLSGSPGPEAGGGLVGDQGPCGGLGAGGGGGALRPQPSSHRWPASPCRHPATLAAGTSETPETSEAIIGLFIMSLMLASNVSFTLIHRGVKNGI